MAIGTATEYCYGDGRTVRARHARIRVFFLGRVGKAECGSNSSYVLMRGSMNNLDDGGSGRAALLAGLQGNACG